LLVFEPGVPKPNSFGGVFFWGGVVLLLCGVGVGVLGWVVAVWGFLLVLGWLGGLVVVVVFGVGVWCWVVVWLVWVGVGFGFVFVGGFFVFFVVFVVFCLVGCGGCCGCCFLLLWCVVCCGCLFFCWFGLCFWLGFFLGLCVGVLLCFVCWSCVLFLLLLCILFFFFWGCYVGCFFWYFLGFSASSVFFILPGVGPGGLGDK
ncbi:hypothetical protein RA274_27505, partial [Pseudomonas syringae pv. tagetis]|uniref:hypothetical protein n=1 Tax=Pseudomonas syringae group genomosp. 7 TaxID=251699 RepID=UPI00376FE0C2